MFRHFYKCNDDEAIRSYDINSVYPPIMLGKLDPYRELHEFPVPMGEPVECMMTVDELLKTDKLFQVMCDLTGSATNTPLLPLKDRTRPTPSARDTLTDKGNKLLFPNPISPTTYVLTSAEFIEAMKHGYKYHKIHKVTLFPNKSTTVFTEYVLTNLLGKFTAEKGLNQEDLDIANEYHTRLFGDLWKPIALSECKHDDNRRQYYKLMLNSLRGTWGKKEEYEQVQKFKQGLVPDSILDKFNSNKIRDLKLIHDFDGYIHTSYYDNCPSQVTRGTNVSSSQHMLVFIFIDM